MEKQNSSSIHYPDAGRGEAGGGAWGERAGVRPKGKGEESSRPVQRGWERGEIMEGGRRRGRIMEEGRRRPKTTQQCRLPVIDEGGEGGKRRLLSGGALSLSCALIGRECEEQENGAVTTEERRVML